MPAKPRVLIFHATGTNRDREAAWACELAGGLPEIVHMNQLLSGERRLTDYQMAVFPGGFSYGDDLGAGKLWAVMVRYRLAEQMTAFIDSGRPLLGICNGFQTLVKSGLLPGGEIGGDAENGGLQFTLTRNDSAQFECRWVVLTPNPDSPCVFTRHLEEPIYCPVAHGEGKFVAGNDAAMTTLESQGLVALRYTDHDGSSGGYPWNPNGSTNDIAGICNAKGNVLGLMPHPEDHIVPEQHPGVHRGGRGRLGLPLFVGGVRHAAEL